MTDTRRTALALRQERDIEAINGKVPSNFAKPQAVLTQVRGLVFWLIVVGFGFFGSMMYLAATSPMQSAVLASGSFEMEGDLQTVDHLEGGILREIHVVEGEEVERGQILARLDGTRVNSQIGILRSQLASALARQARLDAMATGAAQIEFSPEFHSFVALDPSLEKVMARQTELFTSDREADLGQIAIFSERIAQYETRLAGLMQEVEALEVQLLLVADELKDLEKLYENGLVVKARLISRQEDQLGVQARIAQRQSEAQDIQDQIAEVKQRQLQITRDRRSLIADQQQSLTETVFDLRQRLQNYDDIAKRLDIRAPISGQVVGFETNTIGSVVAPGQVLMQIVPRDVPYIIEAQVATADIDEVSVGRPARVRLSAYSYRSTPPIHGEVSYVSGDSFFDTAENFSFYRIHVKIPPDAFDDLPKVSPQSGMPVQVMVATGEHTVLTYLLDPVLGGLERALRESE